MQPLALDYVSDYGPNCWRCQGTARATAVLWPYRLGTKGVVVLPTMAERTAMRFRPICVPTPPSRGCPVVVGKESVYYVTSHRNDRHWSGRAGVPDADL